MKVKELYEKDPEFTKKFFAKINDKVWMRTCQHCGNKQFAIEPDSNKEIPDSYYNQKCKKCEGEECLDFGSGFQRYEFTEEQKAFAKQLQDCEDADEYDFYF